MESAQSPHFPDCFYRVVSKGLCVRDGKIMLIRDVHPGFHEDTNGAWELPGGGLDFGEDFQTALKREVKEEMDLEVTRIDEKPTYFWTYKRLNMRKIPWHYVLIMAFKFDVKDLNYKTSESCQEMKFFSKEELQPLVIADQIEPLKQIFNPTDFS